jgi:hypothetical protein
VRRLEVAAQNAVRLCAVHQVVRAQRFAKKAGYAQHFKMLALATAGHARPDHALEVEAFLDHLGVFLRLVRAWEDLGWRVPKPTATLLTAPRAQAIGDRLRRRLQEVPRLAVTDAPLESGYYDGVRLLLGAETATGQPVNLSDTGLFDWAAKLTSNRRMRFIASGFGLQLLPGAFGANPAP